ncbi:cyclic-di-GMP phosphodiesterase [compost metagenome]
MSTDQKLLGVEVLTRFLKDGLSLLRPTPTDIMQDWTIHEKRAYLIDLIYFITNEEAFFIDNKLFCSLNIDSSTALILKHDSFPVLLKDIMNYCPRIIVSGVFDTELLQYLRDWGVWGVQGDLYESVPLQDVSILLEK